MQTFLTLIGFTACIAAAAFAIIKVVEAVWFFQEFRKEATKTLDRIEEHLRKLKLP